MYSKTIVMRNYAIFFIAIIACLSFAFLEKSVDNNERETISNEDVVVAGVGDKAPWFNLKNIDENLFSFDNIKDANGKDPKGYIVVFTCNTCPVAKANETRLIDLHNKYAKIGYPVVAIQPNDPDKKPGDSFEAMKRYATDKDFPFLYLFDEGQKVYPKYGATKTPEVYLVDANQIIRYHGAIDDSARNANDVEEKFLELAISAVEEGKEPQPAETRAIGCGIR